MTMIIVSLTISMLKVCQKINLLNTFVIIWRFNTCYHDPKYLRRHVTSVARSLQWTIDHLWEVTQLEYNPIENYDRIESWTDTGGGTFQKGKVDTEETFNKGSVTTTLEKCPTVHIKLQRLILQLLKLPTLTT